MKLNLGCGQYPKKGFINVDIDPLAKADVFHDLNVFPYPFEDNQFDEITSDHNLEHLMDPFKTLKELNRLLRPGGRIYIRVPHFSRGFTHADHKRGFDFTFPMYFDPKFEEGYVGTTVKHLRTRMHWFAQPYFKKRILSAPVFWIMRILGFWFDFWANLSPAICSRFWCFWVGGFEEIEFIFTKEK